MWTREGWLYLAVVLDLFSRCIGIVGWATSDRLHKELALTALRRAIAIRRLSPGLVHHADRGSQYCSVAYCSELRRHGIQASMSGKGNCYDNAPVESFFKTLKAEMIWRTVFQSRDQATTAIGHWIDGFYNPVRRHSTLDYISPIAFELSCPLWMGPDVTFEWPHEGLRDAQAQVHGRRDCRKAARG